MKMLKYMVDVNEYLKNKLKNQLKSLFILIKLFSLYCLTFTKFYYGALRTTNHF